MNALGAIATAGAFVVFVMTKFREGAVVMVTVPLGVCVLDDRPSLSESRSGAVARRRAQMPEGRDVMVVIVAL
jgi:hypothetical protein